MKMFADPLLETIDSSANFPDRLSGATLSFRLGCFSTLRFFDFLFDSFELIFQLVCIAFQLLHLLGLR